MDRAASPCAYDDDGLCRPPDPQARSGETKKQPPAATSANPSGGPSSHHLTPIATTARPMSAMRMLPVKRSNLTSAK